MAMLDDLGYVIKCDRCGDVNHYTEENWEAESGHEITYELWKRTIFFGRSLPDALCIHFCKRCAEQVTPLAYAFRDIDELNLFINKLKRSIDEKRRNQNNGATKSDAGKRGERRNEWRFGYRQGSCAAQACEEHF